MPSNILPHRISLTEFRSLTVVTELKNHGQRFEVFFGGRSLGFSSNADPVAHAHKREVNNALYAMQPDAPDFLRKGSVMPAKVALNEYPDLAIRFPREYCLAAAGVEWTEAHNAAAMLEGWAIFNADTEAQVQRDDEAGILGSDDEAFELVMTGAQDHHVVARTLIFVESPAEWDRMVTYVDTVSAGDAPKQRG